MARSKPGSFSVEAATLLRGAADLVDRSPYPLVEAAERLGVGWESLLFVHARGARDRSIETDPKMALTAAAQKIDPVPCSGVAKSRKKSRKR